MRVNLWWYELSRLFPHLLYDVSLFSTSSKLMIMIKSFLFDALLGYFPFMKPSLVTRRTQIGRCSKAECGTFHDCLFPKLNLGISRTLPRGWFYAIFLHSDLPNDSQVPYLDGKSSGRIHRLPWLLEMGESREIRVCGTPETGISSFIDEWFEDRLDNILWTSFEGKETRLGVMRKSDRSRPRPLFFSPQSVTWLFFIFNSIGTRPQTKKKEFWGEMVRCEACFTVILKLSLLQGKHRWHVPSYLNCKFGSESAKTDRAFFLYIYSKFVIE